jgi:hypothetical protein
MIRARCHPALEPLLPKPQLASGALPGWIRSMPAETPAETLRGERVRTLKHCAPMIDALSMGILIPLACDLEVRNGEISWDWDPPVLEDDLIARAPIGLHVREQARGTPFEIGANAFVKFMNFWTLSVPEGHSILFTHPLNRDDLPFRSLSGVVDCDTFADGYVHFPAIWTDGAFSGVLPKGTPVAQALAIPRGAQGLDLGVMSREDIARSRTLQASLGEERGVYRRKFRH